MERIKRDENRVDIANLRPEDIAGDELTGGYIFKLDKGPADWLSQYDVVNNPEQKLRFQYVYPRRTAIQPEQAAYIQSYVDSFENAMVFPDGTFGGKRYDEYIDLESFADHFIISELTKNVDAYRISTYLYKDKDSNGGLLKAGPVWDFNLAFGNANYCNGETDDGWIYDVHCDTFNPFWWGNMFQDEAFINTVKCRWEMFRQGPLQLERIYEFIDQQAALAAPAVSRNFQRWPVLNEYVWPNVVVPGSYQGEIDYLKGFIAARIAWMDANIFGQCLVNNTAETDAGITFTIGPNPASDQIFLQLTLPESGVISYTVYDLLGRMVMTNQLGQQSAGPQSISINTNQWPAPTGFYLFELCIDGIRHGLKQVILK
jgi:hypothetical protein